MTSIIMGTAIIAVVIILLIMSLLSDKGVKAADLKKHMNKIGKSSTIAPTKIYHSRDFTKASSQSTIKNYRRRK